jgi:hypothetical protein
MRRKLPALLSMMAASLLLACGGTSVGGACTTSDDCDPGQTCYTELPGGFCSKGCGNEGAQLECPSDTVCAAHANRLLCAPLCKDKGDCRGDYECNGVSGTNLKVCRPKL